MITNTPQSAAAPNDANYSDASLTLLFEFAFPPTADGSGSMMSKATFSILYISCWSCEKSDAISMQPP